MTTRVAVVTGGGSGIGRATCTRLTADGFTLAVLDVDGEAAKVAAGPDGLGCAADVADPDAVDAAFAQVVGAFGRIDVLVNNAGVSGTMDATVCHVRVRRSYISLVRSASSFNPHPPMAKSLQSPGTVPAASR